MNFLKNLSDYQKGVLFIILGFILLLDVFGFFKPLFYYAILLASLALIVYGMMLSGYWEKLKDMLQGLMKRSKKEEKK